MEVLKTIIVGFIGSLLGALLPIPLGELFGAALFVVVYLRVSKLDIKLPSAVLTTIQIILGLSIGITAHTHDLVESFSFPLFLGLILCMLSQTTVNFFWLYKREQWTPFESLLGAIPGAMAAILVISEEQEKPSPKIIFSHSIRLLLLVVLAGVVATTGEGTSQLSQTVSLVQLPYLALLAALSLLLGKVVGKIGIPAPYLLTSLVVAAIFNAQFSALHLMVPELFIMIATAILGVLIGTRLAPTSLKEALEYSRAGFIVTTLGVSVTIIYALLFNYMTGTDWEVLLLAWVPGSVEAMTAVALLLGLEPAFVAINHVMRLMMLYMMPVVLKSPLQRLSRM
ncbi:Putative ammonia monooxygenase [Vibrio thalassae]|uniref:Ammonia monooxygenase n=1 Tax=Vibrio thalassae TaxID=1243014 RepID=A0A240EG53_9VIBR|nr:AbrB family transcriptional regulator [Vibrio thalassae]SNX47652.1 Putative ammonia monooxygenase [Vibrio thalassae]